MVQPSQETISVRPDVRLVRLVRAAGVGRPEELGKPAGESHRTMSEEDPTLDQHLTVRGGTTRDTAVSTPIDTPAKAREGQ